MAANTYIAVSDVIAGLGSQVYELLGVAVGSDISANTNLLAAIEKANAEIDAYLRPRYDLPLPAVSANLVGHGVGLVRWALVLRNPELATEGDRRIFEDARASLRDLSSGKALLDVGAPEGTSASAGAQRVDIGADNASLPMNQSWIEAY